MACGRSRTSSDRAGRSAARRSVPALYYGADQQAFSHAQVRPIALVYGLICLFGLVATVPVWRAMGLLP